MTFTLTDSAGGSSLALVSGPGRASDTYAQGPTGEPSYDGTQEAEVKPLIRAAYALVVPRGNHTAVKPFGALRQFASPEAADAWAAAHTLAVQNLTRLVFVNGAQTVKLHGAMTVCRCLVSGVSVRIDYQFTYGRVEVT